ncbi:MAG TPA: hypothetical protein P5233_10545 [Candidatus Paceibacterota bacterium]|nr:hypothetical protein [Candidatus Paceibacterota bacterium]
MKRIASISGGFLAAALLTTASYGAVVFTDNFDTAAYPAGGTLAEFQARGWTAVYGTPGSNLGVGTSGNAGATESVFWGNPTAAGNTQAALEYNYMAAPINCGDIITIEANCMRFEGYSYLREIILWDGANPATRVAVATLDAVGKALGPYATWWTPPAKDAIQPLTYVATPADAGKYVIFKYGHSAGWGETADVTFSITPVTIPLFTTQPVASILRTEGESATLTASAIGCNVTYQWNKNGTPLAGKTENTLELAGLTVADSGSYTVTATSPSGSTNSTACVLVVEAKAAVGATLSLGVSFSHNYSGTPFAPAVTDIAYGVHPSRWQVTPPTATGYEMYPAGPGLYTLVWSCNNTYWVGGLPGDLTPGNEQVNFAYLDDGGMGYSVQITGLKTVVGFDKYVVKTIAASDNATNFNTVTLTDDLTAVTETLTYGPLFLAREGYVGKAAVSSSSSVLTNDSITLTSIRVPDTLTRGCLAGFIVTDKPVVVVQPKGPGAPVFNGESFTLSAEAFGVPNLGYQWRKDGAPISGATTATYAKSGAVVEDSGVYDLVVTNAYGTATSLAATVTVVSFIQPTIIQQPTSRTAYLGRTATFSALGYGGQLSYQWNKNGSPIPGATTTTLTLTGLTAADEADYSVTVSNPVGSANSQSAHLTVLPVPTTGYVGAVLADNPVSYWRLDETSGTALEDSWGVNHGSYVGAVALGQPGISAASTAVNFPNSGWVLATPTTYADVPYTPALNPSGAFSVELWVKANGIPSDLFSPLSSLDINSGRAGYLFYLNGGSGWQFRLGNLSGYIATVSGGASSTEWQHIVGVYDGASAYLYVNGVQYGPVAAPGYQPNPAVAFRIGAPTGFSRPWNGLVDEVAFYNYALSPTQVKQHTLAGVELKIAMAAASDIVVNAKPSAGPVHGLNLGATWAATDNDGTATRSGVMQFNATEGDQVSVRAYPELNSTSGTICFWVRVADFSGTGSEAAMVMDRRDTGGSGSGTIIGINDGLYATAGTVFFQANPSGANPFSGITPINDGKWHHVAVSYMQGVGEPVIIYVDGMQDNSSANAKAWYWPANMSVLLGKSRDTYWKKLNGGLDDVRFYNRLLDATEIAQVMTGAVVDDAALVLRLNFDAAPAAGYSLTTTPVSATVQGSANVGSGYTDLGPSPCLYIPSGAMQFFRARAQ